MNRTHLERPLHEKDLHESLTSHFNTQNRSIVQEDIETLIVIQDIKAKSLILYYKVFIMAITLKVNKVSNIFVSIIFNFIFIDSVYETSWFHECFKTYTCNSRKIPGKTSIVV